MRDSFSRFLAFAVFCGGVTLGLFLPTELRAQNQAYVTVKGGTFTMGSPETEFARAADEQAHKVAVDTFVMAKTPVTVADFRKFVRETSYKTSAEIRASAGSPASPGGRAVSPEKNFTWQDNPLKQGENHPLVLVSWLDAVHYANWLSEKEGAEPVYAVEDGYVYCDFQNNGYRLPTEAEWEYAARAGTEGPFYAGSKLNSDQANFDAGEESPQNAKGLFRKTTSPVGSFAPNPWGLHDMAGNVGQWCWDAYDEYRADDYENPEGTYLNYDDRVIRGGSWSDKAGRLRSASRKYLDLEDARLDTGFRLVRSYVTNLDEAPLLWDFEGTLASGEAKVRTRIYDVGIKRHFSFQYREGEEYFLDYPRVSYRVYADPQALSSLHEEALPAAELADPSAVSVAYVFYGFSRVDENYGAAYFFFDATNAFLGASSLFYWYDFDEGREYFFSDRLDETPK